MADVRAELADVLRGRILRAVAGGSLEAGARLPSARELEGEFGVDHRVVLDAYRQLAAENLVEMRPRGGIYVAADVAGRVPAPAESWLSDILGQALAREITLTDLHEWLHAAVCTLRLRAVVLQTTTDQMEGLRRELADDYGLDATGLILSDNDEIPGTPELRYADLLVTTEGLEELARPIAERAGKPLLAVRVRQDLIAGEWRLLLRRAVYVLVGDERFVDVLKEFFRGVSGVENMRVLVVGRDDLGVIPDGAAVYITRSARARLQGAEVRGRILPSVRLLAPESSAALIRFIVNANMAVVSRRLG